jgi:hypothetical protein
MINLFLLIENERSIRINDINQKLKLHRTVLILYVINTNNSRKHRMGTNVLKKYIYTNCRLPIFIVLEKVQAIK